MISVIIPTYNEEATIHYCLESLFKQKDSDFEVIVVDDGSTDNPIRQLAEKNKNLRYFEQDHKGPGSARNLGAKHAQGDILVFVDADMIFDQNFLFELTKPIKDKLTKGTFTKSEYVSNWDNVWAKCWNYNQGIKEKIRIPKEYPNTAPVFRAILKSEFERVKGFDSIGYTDDWTLSRKLGYQATTTKAVCYHKNPASLKEVYQQARWIGKNEFIIGGFKKYFNLVIYSFPFSFLSGLVMVAIYQEPKCLPFKLMYDFGVFISIIGSFFNEKLYK